MREGVARTVHVHIQRYGPQVSIALTPSDLATSGLRVGDVVTIRLKDQLVRGKISSDQTGTVIWFKTRGVPNWTYERITNAVHRAGLGPGDEPDAEIVDVGEDEQRVTGLAGSDHRERSASAAASDAPATGAAGTLASPITAFPLRDRVAILDLARRYFELITPSERAAEDDIERAMPEARRQGFLPKDLFVKIARWKSVRKTPDYESNSPGDVTAATRGAFAAATEDEAIAALKRLNGVALRTATALLHWMRPDSFPILDFRVVGALGEAKPTNWEDVGFYSRISARVRDLARGHELSLRTVDRALWAWQKLDERRRRRGF